MSTIQTRGPENLTKEDWVKFYWFSPLQMIEVLNPSWSREGDSFVSKDYPFMVEMRHFSIPAKGRYSLPGTIANVYLDGMSKILAQNDDQLGFMADPNLKRLYYDKLIVGVENMINEVDNTPAYLKNVPKSIVPEEVAPWDSSQGERATDVAQAVPPVAPPYNPPSVDPKPAPDKPKAETKEFKLNGLTFKSVTDELGAISFFKNDMDISEADYAKAASMI